MDKNNVRRCCGDTHLSKRMARSRTTPHASLSSLASQKRIAAGYIRLAVSMGFIPVWPVTKGRSPSEQAKVYYNYSVQKTFYRNLRKVKDTVGPFGWDARFEPGDFPPWFPGNKRFLGNALTKKCWIFLGQRFGTTVLVMTRSK